jgi:hypothetical protein
MGRRRGKETTRESLPRRRAFEPVGKIGFLKPDYAQTTNPTKIDSRWLGPFFTLKTFFRVGLGNVTGRLPECDSHVMIVRPRVLGIRVLATVSV